MVKLNTMKNSWQIQKQVGEHLLNVQDWIWFKSHIIGRTCFVDVTQRG